MTMLDSATEMLNSNKISNIFNYELRNILHQDKEDVKQNCILEILTAIKKKESLQEVYNFPSFCQTIIQRTVADFIRYRTRKVETNSHLTDFEVESAPSFEFFESSYIIAELHADYERNRQQFSKQERKVLDYMLYNSEAMSRRLAEIARDVSVDRSCSTRAVNKLRELCA